MPQNFSDTEQIPLNRLQVTIYEALPIAVQSRPLHARSIVSDNGAFETRGFGSDTLSERTVGGYCARPMTRV
jgi:hypothetical protein